MARRFIRWARVITGGLNVTSERLRIAFDIRKAFDGEGSGSSWIKIWNLSATSRALVKYEADVSLEAGYGQRIGTIYSGVVGKYSDTSDATDRVMEVEARKLSYRTQKRRTWNTEGPENLRDIVLAGAEELGLAVPEIESIPNDSIPDFVWSESVASAFDQLLTTGRGIAWTEVDGELLFSTSGGGQAPVGVPLDITPETGLIGTPSVDEEGRVKARTLLDPAIRLGGLARIRSSVISGRFRLTGVRHSGDSWEEQFATEVVGLPG